MKKSERRKLHLSINALTREKVAEIDALEHPRPKAKRIDEPAKEAISDAHKSISPRES
jgi:hypothetical protein